MVLPFSAKQLTLRQEKEEGDGEERECVRGSDRERLQIKGGDRSSERESE